MDDRARALAFWREKVDWVVWETGLGGRLDATNIVRPEVCIITNIGLDHQKYLGESLREIAAEKAGIIKPGVPVISAVERARPPR
jgi:dihydrofolate synthase/folylpolyglutamate synthase